MGKKYGTKRGEAQCKWDRKCQQKRRKAPQVDYFRVPKPLWKRIKHLLPEQVKGCRRGRPAIGNRAVLNAIWYVLWTSCQWKALPQSTFGVLGSVAHQRVPVVAQVGYLREYHGCNGALLRQRTPGALEMAGGRRQELPCATGW